MFAVGTIRNDRVRVIGLSYKTRQEARDALEEIMSNFTSIGCTRNDDILTFANNDKVKYVIVELSLQDKA